MAFIHRSLTGSFIHRSLTGLCVHRSLTGVFLYNYLYNDNTYMLFITSSFDIGKILNAIIWFNIGSILDVPILKNV